MSNFHFSMKRNNPIHNTNASFKSNISSHAESNNFQFSMAHNKNSSNCSSCPNNIKDIKFENIDTKTLENELIKAEKNLQSILNNKNVQQPCKNCGLNNTIVFRVKNDNDKIIFDCNPNYYLHFREDYRFEEITILDKQENYIAINENNISNNSKNKLTLNMNKEFYENLRTPLVLTAKCILNNNEYLYVNGVIM